MPGIRFLFYLPEKKTFLIKESMRNYRDFKRKILRDRKMRKAYDKLGPQFEIIRLKANQ